MGAHGYRGTFFRALRNPEKFGQQAKAPAPPVCKSLHGSVGRMLRWAVAYAVLFAGNLMAQSPLSGVSLIQSKGGATTLSVPMQIVVMLTLLTVLPADDRFPDGCFVEDTAVLTGRAAIVTRPGAPSRLGEAESIERTVDGFYPTVFLLNPPSTVDGGDVCQCDDRFLIGVSARTSEAGDMVYADVVDDGPGIAPDAMPRVFEPFFTTKMVGSGTGLGLSVSYGILEEHGGRLSVQSRRGETIFTVELPVGTTPRSAVPADARRPVPRGDGRLALVVEDEPSVLDLIVTMLKEHGWAVDVASGGRAGLESVTSRTYDLIISDMRMPEGGGQEFYTRVREHAPALARRFIFITGDTANVEAWDFLEGAGVPVIEKPFPSSVLEDAVTRVMTPDAPPAS